MPETKRGRTTAERLLNIVKEWDQDYIVEARYVDGDLVPKRRGNEFEESIFSKMAGQVFQALAKWSWTIL